MKTWHVPRALYQDSPQDLGDSSTITIKWVVTKRSR